MVAYGIEKQVRRNKFILKCMNQVILNYIHPNQDNPSKVQIIMKRECIGNKLV